MCSICDSSTTGRGTPHRCHYSGKGKVYVCTSAKLGGKSGQGLSGFIFKLRTNLSAVRQIEQTLKPDCEGLSCGPRVQLVAAPQFVIFTLRALFRLCLLMFFSILTLIVTPSFHSGDLVMGDQSSAASDAHFLCTICSKSFGRAEHRKRHELTHASAKPFRCVQCTKQFVRK